jgi:hypothetical protein
MSIPLDLVSTFLVERSLLALYLYVLLAGFVQKETERQLYMVCSITFG